MSRFLRLHHRSMPSAASTFVLPAILIAGLLFPLSSQARAEDRFGDDDHGRAYNDYATGKSKSLSSATKEATGGKDGKVIGARIKKGKNGGDEYEIRVLRPDGRVVDYSVDASRSDSHHGGGEDEGSGRGRRGRDR